MEIKGFAARLEIGISVYSASAMSESSRMYSWRDAKTSSSVSSQTSNSPAGSRVWNLASHGAMTLWALRTFGEPLLSSWTHQELPAAIAALGWRVLDQSPEQTGVFEAFAVVEVDC